MSKSKRKRRRKNIYFQPKMLIGQVKKFHI